MLAGARVHRLLTRITLLALAWVLLLAPQHILAAPYGGLHQVGQDYHADDLWGLMDGFVLMPSSNLEVQWSVPDPGNKPGGQFKGTDLYSPAEIIAHFRSLPPARTARGIFITGELTHLADLEASKAQMSDYQITKLITDPKWMAAHRKSIQELVQACEKEKIDLWINLNLGVKNLRFQKLTH